MMAVYKLGVNCEGDNDRLQELAIINHSECQACLKQDKCHTSETVTQKVEVKFVRSSNKTGICVSITSQDTNMYSTELEILSNARHIEVYNGESGEYGVTATFTDCVKTDEGDLLYHIVVENVKKWRRLELKFLSLFTPHTFLVEAMLVHVECGPSVTGAFDLEQITRRLQEMGDTTNTQVAGEILNNMRNLKNNLGVKGVAGQEPPVPFSLMSKLFTLANNTQDTGQRVVEGSGESTTTGEIEMFLKSELTALEQRLTHRLEAMERRVVLRLEEVVSQVSSLHLVAHAGNRGGRHHKLSATPTSRLVKARRRRRDRSKTDAVVETDTAR